MSGPPSKTPFRADDPMHQMMERMYEQDMIDALRPHLKTEKIFMDADDWRSTPVRLDMLKGLARRWKLNNRPDFWKENNSRIKLAKALMEYIIQRQEDERRLSIMPTSKPKVEETAATAAGTSQEINVSAVRALRKALPRYTGDLFGTRSEDYAEGLLYLSRMGKPTDPLREFAQEQLRNAHDSKSTHDAKPGHDSGRAGLEAKAGGHEGKDSRSARRPFRAFDTAKSNTLLRANMTNNMVNNRRLSTFLSEFNAGDDASPRPDAESALPAAGVQNAPAVLPPVKPSPLLSSPLPSPPLPSSAVGPSRRASEAKPGMLLDGKPFKAFAPKAVLASDSLPSIGTTNSLFASSSQLTGQAIAAAAADGRVFGSLDSTTQLLYDAAAAVAREERKAVRQRKKEGRLRRRMLAILHRIRQQQNFVASAAKTRDTTDKASDVSGMPTTISKRARRGSLQLVPDAYANATGGLTSDILQQVLTLNDSLGKAGPSASAHENAGADVTAAVPEPAVEEPFDDAGSLASTPRTPPVEKHRTTLLDIVQGNSKSPIIIPLDLTEVQPVEQAKHGEDESGDDSDVDDAAENATALAFLVEHGLLPAGVSVFYDSHAAGVGASTVSLAMDAAELLKQAQSGKLDVPLEVPELEVSDDEDFGIAGVDDDDDPTAREIAKQVQSYARRSPQGDKGGTRTPSPKRGLSSKLLMRGHEGQSSDFILQQSLRQQCAQALRELSKKPGNRVHIMAEGAHAALVQVLLDSDSFNTKLDCATALANLSAVQPTLIPSDLAKGLGMSTEQAEGAQIPSPPASAKPGAEAKKGHRYFPVSPTVVHALADLARRLAATADAGSKDPSSPGSPSDETKPAKGWSDTINRASMRCLVATTLYNMSCDKRTTRTLAQERGIEALLLLLPLLCKSYSAQHASEADTDHTAEGAEGTDASASHKRTPLASLTDLDLLISADAYTLVIVVRALANIAAAPNGIGVQAIIDLGGLVALASQWNWMSAALRVIVAAQIVEPCTRLHSSLLRIAGDGGVLLLRSAIRSLYREQMQAEAAIMVGSTLRDALGQGARSTAEEDDEFEPLSAGTFICSAEYKTWAVRRMLVALSRLTTSRQGIVRVMRGFGCAAIGEAVEMLLHDLYSSTATGINPSDVYDNVVHHDEEDDLPHLQRLSDLTEGKEHAKNATAKTPASSPSGPAPAVKDGGNELPGLRVPVGGAQILRRVASALHRLLVHARGHVSAQQGIAGTAAAILLTVGTHDMKAARAALHCLAYAFASPLLAEYATIDGAAVALLHYVQFLLRLAASEQHAETTTPKKSSFSAGAILPLAMLALYNASCHSTIVARLLLAPAVPPAAADFALSLAGHNEHPMSYAKAYFGFRVPLENMLYCRNAAYIAFVSRRVRVFEARVISPTVGSSAYSTIHDLLTAGRQCYAGVPMSSLGNSPSGQPTPAALLASGLLDPSYPGLPSIKYNLAALSTFIDRLQSLQLQGPADFPQVDASYWFREQRFSHAAVGLAADGGASPGLFNISYRMVSFALAVLRNLSAIEEEFLVPHTSGSLISVDSKMAALHSGIVQIVVPLLSPRTSVTVQLPASLGPLNGPASIADMQSVSKAASARLQATQNSGLQPVNLPLSAIADVLSIITNVSQHHHARRSLVASGVLPMLVPIAAGAPSSAMMAGRAFSLYHLKQRQLELQRQMTKQQVDTEDSIQHSPRLRADSDGRRPSLIINLPSSDGGAVSLISPQTKPRARRGSVTATTAAPDRSAHVHSEGVAGLANAHPGLVAEQSRLESLLSRARAACALGLCNLAADAGNVMHPSGDNNTGDSTEALSIDPEVVKREGILQALIALSNFAADDDPIRLRVAQALHAFSGNEVIAKMILDMDMGSDALGSPGPSTAGKQFFDSTSAPTTAVSTLVSLSSSNVEGVRRECAGALYNLSRLPGYEAQLIEAGAVRALMVIALIRSQHPDTQAVCVEAVHNLLTRPDDRLAALKKAGSGSIVWALAKLSLSSHVAVQRACAITMYRLASGAETQDVLVREGGLRSVITVLRRQHASANSEAIGSAKLPEEAEEEERAAELLNQLQAAVDHEDVASSSYAGSAKFQLSLQVAKPRSPAGKADAIVGALFAGVLAAVSSRSSEQGHLTKLVAQGAVEALVLLSGTAANVDAGGASARGGVSRSSSSTDITQPSGYDTDAKGMAKLRPSCALGLYNMAASPRVRVRNRVAAGGSAVVFVGVGCDVLNESRHTRRLCALGLANLLWGCASEIRTRLVENGALKVFISLGTIARRVTSAADDTALDGYDEDTDEELAAIGVPGVDIITRVSNVPPLRDAFLGALALHFASQHRELHAQLVKDGAIAALLKLTLRIKDDMRVEGAAIPVSFDEDEGDAGLDPVIGDGSSSRTASSCYLGARTALLAAAALANLMSSGKASRRAVADDRSIKYLIKSVLLACKRLSALDVEDVGVTSQGHLLMAFPYGRLGMERAIAADSSRPAEVGSPIVSPQMRSPAAELAGRVPDDMVLREIDVLVGFIDNAMVSLATLSAHRSCHATMLQAGITKALTAVFTCGDHKTEHMLAKTQLVAGASPSSKLRNRRSSITVAAAHRVSARLPALPRLRAGIILRNLSVSPQARNRLLEPECRPLLVHLVTLMASADRPVQDLEQLPTSTVSSAKANAASDVPPAVSPPMVRITSDLDAGRVLLDDSLVCMLPVKFPGHSIPLLPAVSMPTPTIVTSPVVRRTSTNALRSGAQAFEAKYGSIATAAVEALGLAPDNDAPTELPPIIGTSEVEAERVASIGFALLEDAAKMFCNIAQDADRHSELVSSGGALALISVSESPFCPADLRTACLRSLCELAIEDRDKDENASTGALADKTAGVTLAVHRSTAPAASRRRGSLAEEPEDETTNMVSTGAVSALIAMMGNSAESANEMRRDAVSTSIFGPDSDRDEAILLLAPRIGAIDPIPSESIESLEAVLQVSARQPTKDPLAVKCLMMLDRRCHVLTSSDIAEDDHLLAVCNAAKALHQAALAGGDVVNEAAIASRNEALDVAASLPGSIVRLMLPDGSDKKSIAPSRRQPETAIAAGEGLVEEEANMWPKIFHVPLENDGPEEVALVSPSSGGNSVYTRFATADAAYPPSMLSLPMSAIPPNLQPTPDGTSKVAGSGTASQDSPNSRQDQAVVNVVWDYGHHVVLAEAPQGETTDDPRDAISTSATSTDKDRPTVGTTSRLGDATLGSARSLTSAASRNSAATSRKKEVIEAKQPEPVPFASDMDFELAFPYVIQPDAYIQDSALGPYPRLQMHGEQVDVAAKMTDEYVSDTYPDIIDPGTHGHGKRARPIYLITAALSHRGDYIDTAGERAAIRRMLWVLTSPASLPLPAALAGYTGSDSTGLTLTDVDALPLPEFPDFVMAASGQPVGVMQSGSRDVGMGHFGGIATVLPGLRLSRCELREADEIVAGEFTFDLPPAEEERQLLASKLSRKAETEALLVQGHGSRQDLGNKPRIPKPSPKSGMPVPLGAQPTESSDSPFAGHTPVDPAFDKLMDNRAKWMRRVRVKRHQIVQNDGRGNSSPSRAGTSGLNPLMSTSGGAAPSLAITLGLHAEAGGRETLVIGQHSAPVEALKPAVPMPPFSPIREPGKASQPARTPTRPQAKATPSSTLGQRAQGQRSGHRVITAATEPDIPSSILPEKGGATAVRTYTRRVFVNELGQREHAVEVTKHIRERQEESRQHQLKAYGQASTRPGRGAKKQDQPPAHALSLKDLLGAISIPHPPLPVSRAGTSSTVRPASQHDAVAGEDEHTEAATSAVSSARSTPAPAPTSAAAIHLSGHSESTPVSGSTAVPRAVSTGAGDDVTSQQSGELQGGEVPGPHAPALLPSTAV